MLLHELGHVPQTDYAGLYNCSKPSHFKMEAEATEYMLKEEVKTYLMENDLDCKSINPVVFLENRHLSLRYAPVVEKILLEISKGESVRGLPHLLECEVENNGKI